MVCFDGTGDTARPVEWIQTRSGGQSRYVGVSQSEGVDTTSGQAGARSTAFAVAKYGRADQRLEGATWVSNNAGQHYILQINKAAEDILYPRFGKMAWGVGSVYLPLKKRHPDDGNDNTLRTGEEDLNLEDIQEICVKVEIRVS